MENKEAFNLFKRIYVDLAIVELEEEVQLGERQSYLCIPKREQEFLSEEAWMAGAGVQDGY